MLSKSHAPLYADILHPSPSYLTSLLYKNENPPPLSLFLTCPHRLQLLQYQVIRIHEPIHAILYTWLLIFVEFAVGDLGGDAFAEAHVRQAMDCYEES